MDRRGFRILVVIFVVFVLAIAFLLLKLGQTSKLTNQGASLRKFDTSPVSSPSPTPVDILAQNGDSVFMLQGTFPSSLKVEGGTVVGDFIPNGKTGTLRAIFTATDAMVGFGKYQQSKTVFTKVTGSSLISLINPGKHYELRIVVTSQQKDYFAQIQQMSNDANMSGKSYYVVVQTIAELP